MNDHFETTDIPPSHESSISIVSHAPAFVATTSELKSDPSVLRAGRFQLTLETGQNYLLSEDRQYLIGSINILRKIDSPFYGVKNPKLLVKAIFNNTVSEGQKKLLHRIQEIAPDMDVNRVLTAMLSDLLRMNVSKKNAWEEGPVAQSWIHSLESHQKISSYSVTLDRIPDFALSFSTIFELAKQDEGENKNPIVHDRSKRVSATLHDHIWQLTFQDTVKIIRNHLYLFSHDEDYRESLDIANHESRVQFDWLRELRTLQTGLNLNKNHLLFSSYVTNIAMISPHLTLQETQKNLLKMRTEGYAEEEDQELDEEDNRSEEQLHDWSHQLLSRDRVLFTPPLFDLYTPLNNLSIIDRHVIDAFLLDVPLFWTTFEETVKRIPHGEKIIQRLTAEELEEYNYGKNEEFLAKFFALDALYTVAQYAKRYTDDPDMFNRQNPIDYDTAIQIYNTFHKTDLEFQEDAHLDKLRILRVHGPLYRPTNIGPISNAFPYETRFTSWDEPLNPYWETLKTEADKVILEDGNSIFTHVQNATSGTFQRKWTEKRRNTIDQFLPLYTIQLAIAEASNKYLSIDKENIFEQTYHFPLKQARDLATTIQVISQEAILVATSSVFAPQKKQPIDS
jgi:hypothetical protein